MFTHDDYFHLRVPSFPISANFQDFNILEVRENPDFMNALHHASESLYYDLLSFEENNDTERAKIELATYKYYLRGSYRSTPFGLFSGTALGKFGDHSNIKFNTKNRVLKCDVEFPILWRMVESLKQTVLNGELHDHVRLFPNSTIYQNKFGCRYVEFKESYNEFYISQLELDGVLDLILESSSEGATLSKLLSIIKSLDSFNEADILDYLYELIRCNVLIINIKPSLYEDDAFLDLAKQLKELKFEEFEPILDYYKSDIETIHKVKKLKKFRKLVKESGLSNNSNVIKIDQLFACEDAFIDAAIPADIKKAIEIIHRIPTEKKDESNDNLNLFALQFIKKYGEEEVALLEVLDPENGLGYPYGNSNLEMYPLLSNLDFTPSKIEVEHSFGEWDSILMNKVIDSIRTNKDEIFITEDDISTLNSSNNKPLPNSFSTQCSILYPKEGDKKTYLINYIGSSGPSSANIMARFTRMDESLAEQVKNSIIKEEQLSSKKIFAELDYYPGNRASNISMRARLRNYSINLLPFSSNDSNEIELRDLVVSVSSTNMKITLKSKKLNREIVPRLSSAHNTRFSLPHYRFLFDLQRQSQDSSIYWSWGALRSLKVLPRVRIGNVIVAKRKWLLEKRDIPLELYNAKFIDEFKSKLEEIGIPQNSTLTEGDNLIPINLSSHLSIKFLQQALMKTNGKITIEEDLFADNNSFVQSEKGFHNHEIIIPWYREKENYLKKNEIPLKVRADKTFPGEEVAYFKVYANTSYFDELIVKLLSKVAVESNKILTHWFFIKYSDEYGEHLRVRYFLKRTEDRNMLENQFYSEAANHHDIIWRINLGTYVKEIERYGEKNMQNSEYLFCFDSQAVVNFLGLCEFSNREDERWRFAFVGVDRLMNDFGFSLKEKFDQMEVMSKNFKNEFQFFQKKKLQGIAKKYRLYRNELIELIKNCNTSIHQVFDVRTKQNERIAETIIKEIASDNIHTSQEIMGSYIHMFLNRTFKDHSRMQEMVLYDFLYNHYKSEIAIKKKIDKNKEFQIA